MSDAISAEEYNALQAKQKRSKYGNQRVREDGYTFDSLMEHRRYCELRLMLQQGEISWLVVHPRYPLEVNGHRITTYEADFRYLDHSTGQMVVEDVKTPGTRTRLYILKMLLMKAIHGITIVEVEA